MIGATADIRILLINPNTSQATTAQMVALAQAAAPAGVQVVGATARAGVPMIVDGPALAGSAGEVVEVGTRLRAGLAGVIVGAFGDPGADDLRAMLDIPVVGIAEAGMLEAAAGGRRFGIATVTPGLVGAITARVSELGVVEQFCGVRLTDGDPVRLAADRWALVEGLAGAVRASFEIDRAEAVVIGGGPLGDAAATLVERFTLPVIAPIPAALRRVLALLK